MAKYSQGNLDLLNKEKIIHGGKEVLGPEQRGTLSSLKLNQGTRVNNISNSESLSSDSTSSIVTEHAIKTYVDDAVSTGTSGSSGTSGIDGTSGSSGTSGSGTSGTSGITGTSGTSGSSGTSGIGTSGTSGTSGAGSGTLDGLSDVNITTPQDEEILSYDSTSMTWINQVNSGGIPDPLTLGTVTVTQSLRIPTSAPVSPAAGNIWIE